MDAARAGWGDVPEWVAALVQACDNTSQNKVADRLGVSSSTVSQTIRNIYPGRTETVAERVRAIFMNDEIVCPALGEMTSEACLNWRDRSKSLASASPIRVRMFNACRRCPRNNQEDGK